MVLLNGYIVAEAQNDRVTAIRLAHIAARYAVRVSKQKIGSVSGQQLVSEGAIKTKIISAMFSNASELTRTLARVDRYIYMENGKIVHEYRRRKPFRPCEKDWRQAIHSVFDIARRTHPQAENLQANVEQWEHLLTTVPHNDILEREVVTAERKIKKIRGTDFLNETVQKVTIINSLYNF
jgi:hypothetical protein